MSAALEATEPVWLRALRATAFEQFHARGLPSAKNESWRFTNRRALAARPPEGPAELTLRGPQHPGLRFCSFADLLAQDPARLQALLALPDHADGYAALNLAKFHTGFVLELAPGVTLDEPLELIHVNEGGSTHLRGIVLLGEGACATLVERHMGTGWTSSITHMALAEGTRLRHVKCQEQARDSIHLAATTLTLGASADHESVLLTIGAAASREAVTALLEGEGAKFSLRGAYLLGDRQETSYVPEVTHLAPRAASRQLVKGVLGGAAHGIFLGHIGVPEGADGTDAAQTSRSLLLSTGARADTRPRLEILADDVRCSHGATIGDLDEAAAFYLQSRGLAPHEARRMLIESFAAEIIDGADLPAALRAPLLASLAAWVEAMP